MPDKQICPVCKKTVGNDPHEACFESLQETVEDPGWDRDMPCPACGKPLGEQGCQNPACEEATGV